MLKTMIISHFISIYILTCELIIPIYLQEGTFNDYSYLGILIIPCIFAREILIIPCLHGKFYLLFSIYMWKLYYSCLFTWENLIIYILVSLQGKL